MPLVLLTGKVYAEFSLLGFLPPVLALHHARMGSSHNVGLVRQLSK